MLATLLAGIAVGIALIALRLATQSRIIICVHPAAEPQASNGPSLPPFIESLSQSQPYRTEGIPHDN